MHHYLAFGLHLESDAPLSYVSIAGARQPPGCAKVGLRASHTLALRADLAHEEPDFEGGPVLRIFMPADAASALVEYAGWRVLIEPTKRHILYERISGAPEVELRFVCERVLIPLYLLCDPGRDVLAMHGGAMCWKEQGWIMLGESGAGKSTSTLDLTRQGAHILSDDMALVDVTTTMALPGSPTLRLWREMVQEADEHQLVPGTTDKRWFRLSDERAAPQGAPLAGIIVLTPQPGADPRGELSTLGGMDALVTLLQNTFDLHHPPHAWQRARLRRARCLLEQTRLVRCAYERSPDGRRRQVEGIIAAMDAHRERS